MTVSKKNWYKIVEYNEDRSIIKSLFHGTKGSRLLTKEKWLKADKKLVKDGSGKTEYVSGFQVVNSFEDCLKYLQLFRKRKNKAIVTCLAKKVRPKSHSRHPVFLADEIKIKRSPIVYVSESDDT